MLGDPLAAVVREMLMNPILTPPSPAYLALRRDIEAIGEVRGKAESLLAVLAARKLLVDDTTRATITSCSDRVVLEHWITRAATAKTLDEVFAPACDAA